jgi:TonB family protein
VDSIQVVKRLDPQLDRNAIGAVASWKFSPATRNGQPVAVEVVIHIPFNAPPQQ